MIGLLPFYLPSPLNSAFAGLLALLCGNGYIVGINQIYDVEIDAVNKPFLPVAAGELSKPIAWVSGNVHAPLRPCISAETHGSSSGCKEPWTPHPSTPTSKPSFQSSAHRVCASRWRQEV